MSGELAQDKTWLAAYRAGDRDALRRVFDAYVSAVDVIIRRGTVTKDGSRRVPGVSSAEGVEDVVQDVFVKVFSATTRENYDGERPFLPFVRQIARHTLIDHHRKQGRAPELIDVETDEVLWVDGPPLPDDVVSQKELIESVQMFKAQLSEADQRFVSMRFVEGLGQRDVAKKLDVTRTEVRKRDDDVRDRLRAFLKELLR